MSGSQALGGTSRVGRVLGPSLDKIMKNAAWRSHSALVSSAKSALDTLGSLPEGSDPLADPSVAESLLGPLVAALSSATPKVVEPALECLARLFSLGMIRAEVDVGDAGIHGDFNSFVFHIIDSVSKTIALREDAIELGVLRVLLSAVRSPSVLIRGDCLVYIVRTCYNIYLGGVNGTNQICAKAVLAQMMIIIFARVQENSMAVSFRTISVAELLEFTDRNLNEGSSVHFAQNLVNEVVEVNETSNGVDFGSSLKIKDDGFMLYKYLCKLSIKFSSPDYSDDQILLRGKILSLELLKVIMDNANQVWLTDEIFVDAMKKFLCMSLLKNSALSMMTIFQLMCSIFKTLITKFRSVLKSELGVFFNMLILRVLENVLQPSFLQKMTVLNLLEKLSQDPQMIVDIFVNYDCDVDALNVFERTVNGLLKTAVGPSPGSTTTMAPAQDITFRFESVKCLVRVLKSMGAWMDQQLKTGEVYPVKNSENDKLIPNNTINNGEEGTENDNEVCLEAESELADAATLERRRAYKLELQKGVSLFNQNPSKGINFLISTKKVGSSPEDVAFFLKNTTGLNETMIGDYLSEREDFPLRVMHAYVESFKLEGLDFGEAIRYFLRGFRLPGEVQKIDQIMEKFAERYCKCNPNSFTSAETAYVLAYSVILLYTDAHNSFVQDKMSKADFIRNNRGINNGKDLPEEYLGAIYDQIVKNEINMNGEFSAPQSKQTNSLDKLLGLDGIRNLVWKQTEEKQMSANGDLIRCIQEQFKAKSDKPEPEYQSIANVAILRFMMEVCWGPMLAAFSMTLDQSDDKAATSQCLHGFRYAVHVTSVMGMQTQRDAFVTTVAKFTYLHCAADMKQKNIEAMKAIIAIAIEDGNDLQEAWEHILTCLSRFEHLQILGEGAPSGASFFTTSKGEADDKAMKSSNFPSLKKKGTIQNPAVAAVVRGSSYDSTTTGVNSSGLVRPEKMSNFISNLNLLDQIGNFELNHIFAQSQRLNNDATVAFVKALCKVSMSELQSATDPRVFSLTKIVEVAHYNMNRIRLVWSPIWSVLSDFFAAVGLSENLSVAIFVMDSLRQLAMKFLEREELANYNFQNEFLKPFVIVMQKSSSAEIRELIVRCISQMVLSRVSNVKSGWKSVFLVFTTAAYDERKNIVLLAFETMEKLVRECFPCITETETMAFTSCVGCLITFTKSKLNSDVSLNAIAFLRFCAFKLADAGLVCNENNRVVDSSVPEGNDEITGEQAFTNKFDYISFWIPLLTGLSKLTFDPREAIRMGALEVLFNILKDHGHLFSTVFWNRILNSVVFPIYNYTNEATVTEISNDQSSPASVSPHSDRSSWDSEMPAVAIKCLLDLFTNFFIMLRSKMSVIVSILVTYIKSPGQAPAKIGVSALKRLAGDLGDKFSTDEWEHIFLALKEAAATSLPGITNLIRTMDIIDIPEIGHPSDDVEMNGQVSTHLDSEDDNLQTAAYVVSRMKSHFAEQLLIVQVMNDLFKKHQKSLSPSNIRILTDIFSCISAHAQKINSEIAFRLKLQRACSIQEISEPPLVSFESESFQNYLDFLHDLLLGSPLLAEELDIEPLLVSVCENVLLIYLDCCGSQAVNHEPQLHWIIPLGSVKKEELAARTPLTVSSLRILSDFESFSFKRYASRLFPLFVELVRSEHSSREVQLLLCYIFQSCIGPMLLY